MSCSAHTVVPPQPPHALTLLDLWETLMCITNIGEGKIFLFENNLNIPEELTYHIPSHRHSLGAWGRGGRGPQWRLCDDEDFVHWLLFPVFYSSSSQRQRVNSDSSEALTHNTTPVASKLSRLVFSLANTQSVEWWMLYLHCTDNTMNDFTSCGDSHWVQALHFMSCSSDRGTTVSPSCHIPSYLKVY